MNKEEKKPKQPSKNRDGANREGINEGPRPGCPNCSLPEQWVKYQYEQRIGRIQLEHALAEDIPHFENFARVLKYVGMENLSALGQNTNQTNPNQQERARQRLAEEVDRIVTHVQTNEVERDIFH